jgi:hypothetical protein
LTLAIGFNPYYPRDSIVIPGAVGLIAGMRYTAMSDLFFLALVSVLMLWYSRARVKRPRLPRSGAVGDDLVDDGVLIRLL